MMFADIASGHTALADWLFLIAAVVTGLAAVFSMRGKTLVDGVLAAAVLIGLCLVAVAWLVL